MVRSVHTTGLLVMAALAGCMAQEGHPVDRYLSTLRPVTIAPLKGLDRPAGTLVCPMTPYQSLLPASEPLAERVNAYMKRKHFMGEEARWSLVTVEPGLSGSDGIEHLLIRSTGFVVVTDAQGLKQASREVPAGFHLQTCVPVEKARVLAAHGLSRTTVIAFGLEAR